MGGVVSSVTSAVGGIVGKFARMDPISRAVVPKAAEIDPLGGLLGLRTPAAAAAPEPAPAPAAAPEPPPTPEPPAPSAAPDAAARSAAAVLAPKVSAPEAPAAAPPPPGAPATPGATEPTASQAGVDAAAESERKRRARAAQGLNPTGGLGDTSAPNLAAKSLLGA